MGKMCNQLLLVWGSAGAMIVRNKKRSSSCKRKKKKMKKKENKMGLSCAKLSSRLNASWLRNKLPRVGSAAIYLEDQRPLISFIVKIMLTQPQVELELGLSLAIKSTHSRNKGEEF